MNPKFHEMLAKKRDMKPSEKHAKLGVLKDLKDSLSDSMGDKLDGMKKVSVMSNSPEGLNAGLDKAKQMAQGQDPDSDMQTMSEGGIAMNTDPNESEHVTYEGTPHDDGFMHPNDNEAYSTGIPMDEHAESKQNPDEPIDVKYMSEGGEATPDEITYSGNPDDDGFMHPDSGEAVHGASYSEGGKVKSPLNEAADEADEEREETEGDMGDDSPPMYKGMKLQEVEEHLQHLMRMKKQMEQQ